MMALASSAIRTFREWALIFLCALLFLMAIYPVVGIELYPVIDHQGHNLTNMETDKTVYHCGDVVRARMTFQKQRNVSGVIKWFLIDGPDSHVDLYPARVAGFPAGLYDKWVDIERIPPICKPGKYHFEGTVSYQLMLGNVSYPLRTQCFEVVSK